MCARRLKWQRQLASLTALRNEVRSILNAAGRHSRHKSIQPHLIMAHFHFMAQNSVRSQLTKLLEKFENRKTRGLWMSVRGNTVTVDTLAYATNVQWRKFKVKAADRERAFMDWVRPQVTDMVKQIQVHPAAWHHLDVMACIYYESGELEVEVNMKDGDIFDRTVALSDTRWDGTPKEKPQRAKRPRDEVEDHGGARKKTIAPVCDTEQKSLSYPLATMVHDNQGYSMFDNESVYDFDNAPVYTDPVPLMKHMLRHNCKNGGRCNLYLHESAWSAMSRQQRQAATVTVCPCCNKRVGTVYTRATWPGDE